MGGTEWKQNYNRNCIETKDVKEGNVVVVKEGNLNRRYKGDVKEGNLKEKIEM